MSLANLFVQGGRAVLQADAAGTCATTGEVRFLGPKLHPVASLPIAITARGAPLDIDVYQAEISRHRFTDANTFFGALPDMLSSMGATMAANDWPPMSACFYIIAWLDDRPCGFVIATDRSWFSGALEPYKLTALLNTVSAIVPVAEMLGRTVDFADPASFDIERDSLQLIEAQRRIPWADFPAGSNLDAVLAHRIGGWVDQAEVSEKGVRWRRLVDWPQDRMGERIAA